MSKELTPIIEALKALATGLDEAYGILLNCSPDTQQESFDNLGTHVAMAQDWIHGIEYEWKPDVSEEEMQIVADLLHKHSNGLISKDQPGRNLASAVLVSLRTMKMEA